MKSKYKVQVFRKKAIKKPCTLLIQKQRQNTLLSLFLNCSVSITVELRGELELELWHLENSFIESAVVAVHNGKTSLKLALPIAASVFLFG